MKKIISLFSSILLNKKEEKSVSSFDYLALNYDINNFDPCKKTILIIDDSPGMINIIKEYIDNKYLCININELDTNNYFWNIVLSRLNIYISNKSLLVFIKRLINIINLFKKSKLPKDCYLYIYGINDDLVYLLKLKKL